MFYQIILAQVDTNPLKIKGSKTFFSLLKQEETTKFILNGEKQKNFENTS